MNYWECRCGTVNKNTDYVCKKCYTSKEKSKDNHRITCQRCGQNVGIIRSKTGLAGRERQDGKFVCGLCPEASPIDIAIEMGKRGQKHGITKHWYIEPKKPITFNH